MRTKDVNIWRLGLPGYMSVEAACVFVTALSVVVFAISIGLYQFEKCAFELESLYELQKTIGTGQDIQEYIERDEMGIRLNRQKEIGLYMGIPGEKDCTLQIEVKVYEPDPVMVLRLRRSLKRINENEYSKN